MLWSMDSSLDVLLSQFGTSRITSWQIGGETVETVTDFIFLGSKITADGDCNHEMKKTLGSLKKSCDQPRQHIKKQRHYFANKVSSSQSCGGFLVVICGCESWITKKLSIEELML